MKTFLVPVDFSAASTDTALYALELARRLHARVSLLHICPLPVGAIDIPYPEEKITGLVKEAKEKMDALMKKIQTFSGRRKISVMVRCGSFMEELSLACEAEHPYMIIMSSHGVGRSQSPLKKSNTRAVLLKLTVPVLVLPPGIDFNEIKHIALACDMKHLGEGVPVKMIGGLLKMFNAALSVVHIDTRRTYDSQFTEESMKLQDLLRPLRPAYHFLNKVQVEEGLLSFTEKNNIDMLIMLPGKYHLVEKLVHGSRTANMALYAGIPVLSIHKN